MGWLFDAIAQAIAEHTFEPLRRWLGRVAASESTVPERIDCSLRSVRKPAHGITRSWVPGVASVSPGRLEFSPCDDADAVVTITVSSISPALPDDSLGTARDARVSIHTDEGILECTMQRAVIDRVRQIVLSR